jgi:hypothetical protein
MRDEDVQRMIDLSERSLMEASEKKILESQEEKNVDPLEGPENKKQE